MTDDPINESELPRVECFQAFRWTCLECAQENFDAASLVTFEDEEEEREAKAALGIEPWEEGGVVEVPTVVTCRRCEARFRTFDQERIAPPQEEAEPYDPESPPDWLREIMEDSDDVGEPGV